MISQIYGKTLCVQTEAYRAHMMRIILGFLCWHFLASVNGNSNNSMKMNMTNSEFVDYMLRVSYSYVGILKH